MKEQLCEQGGGLCCGLEETPQKKVNEKEIMLELVTMWFEKKNIFKPDLEMISQRKQEVIVMQIKGIYENLHINLINMDFEY